MEFMDAVRERRTVRRFRPDPVPEEAIEQILEAGRLAAAGRYASNWHFGVVTDPELKRELVDAAGQQEWIATAPVVLALCVKLGPDLKDCPDDDLVLRVNRIRFTSELVDYLNAYPDRRAMKILTQNGNVFIPGQQMFLAAADAGLRGCWIGYLDIERASRLLQLPDDVVCLFLLPVGYADEEPEVVERRSLDDMTFYDCWS